MKFDRKKYPDSLLQQLYEELLWPRLIEEKMLILLRQNKISKWFSGIGQEAISVGVTQALDKDEYIFLELNQQGQFLWVKEGAPSVKMLQAFVEFIERQGGRGVGTSAQARAAARNGEKVANFQEVYGSSIYKVAAQLFSRDKYVDFRYLSSQS